MPLTAAEFERLAAELPPGADPERVRGLLGEPLVISELAGGGQTWLYVPADPARGQWESLSVAFDAAGRLTGLQRKPID